MTSSNPAPPGGIDFWVEFGLEIIPIKQLSPVAAVEADTWRANYSGSAVKDHFVEHPRDRVGAVVPDGIIGFRTASAEFDGALSSFLRSLGAAPMLWLPAGSFYRLADGESISDWSGVLPEGILAIGPGDTILLPVGEKLERGHFGGSMDDLAIISLPIEEGNGDADPPAMELVDTPLAEMSVRGSASSFEERALKLHPLLGNVAMLGQATVWYAPPNSGKTLIALALLLEAVRSGHILAGNAYYLNADDNGNGIAEKARLLDDAGVHTLIPGENGFEPFMLAGRLDEMAAEDRCRGVVIIIDTIKKFVDVMDKRQTAIFAGSVRRFTQKGGTCLSLAHTRKNPNANGKAVYGGTTDLIEDSDAVYMLSEAVDVEATGEKVVKFEGKKKRGGGADEAYAFAADPESYDELLASVRLVDADQMERITASARRADDQTIVDMVFTCIAEGIDKKMFLAVAVAERLKISRRAAVQVIERYEGNLWTYSVQARGAKVYRIAD
ncbi:AAA family ATPase [Sphingobium estronivorans]|uniref:AAA family ATPase n=1 Tax=Sphingobium estronivorans TaxID=1577690 RepID=UPI0013C30C33|nr:AAA family ATPase [Sphingobium estronivorans]